jgi:hypothetical protein
MIMLAVGRIERLLLNAQTLAKRVCLPKTVEPRYSASAAARHPIVALIRTETVYAKHIVQSVFCVCAEGRLSPGQRTFEPILKDRADPCRTRMSPLDPFRPFEPARTQRQL